MRQNRSLIFLSSPDVWVRPWVIARSEVITKGDGGREGGRFVCGGKGEGETVRVKGGEEEVGGGG